MSFAFIFESVGGTEWFVLLGVILIVVGPKNLPSAARKLGQIMTNLRRAADEFKRQLLSMDQEVRKTVEDAVADDTSTASTTTSGGDDADRAEYEGHYDDSGNPYPDGSPYPGNDDSYFDETGYQNDYGPDPADTDSEQDAGATDSAAESESEPPSKTAPTDEELRSVKITVSPRPGSANQGT